MRTRERTRERTGTTRGTMAPVLLPSLILSFALLGVGALLIERVDDRRGRLVEVACIGCFAWCVFGWLLFVVTDGRA